MKIKAVRYGALRSFGNFNNARAEIEATIEDGDDPDVVFGQLKADVDGKLGREAQIYDLDQARDRLMRDVARLEERRDTLREESRALIKALQEAEGFVEAAQKKDVAVPQSVQEALESELPF